MRHPTPYGPNVRYQSDGFGVVDTWSDDWRRVWCAPVRRHASGADRFDLRRAPRLCKEMATLLNGTGPRAERARREAGL